MESKRSISGKHRLQPGRTWRVEAKHIDQEKVVERSWRVVKDKGT